MKHNKLTKWITGAAVATSLFSAPAFSATVFEDLFDQVGVTALPFQPSPDLEWQYRYATVRGVPTRASIGDGVLAITTEEPKFGGVSTSRSDAYDFFNQELTYTFSGLNLEPIGQSAAAYQWAKLGVFAGDGSIWYAGSYFVVGYNGAGRFTVQVQQPSLTTNRLESIYIKDFKVPYFNFDINELSKVQLTLDDTYFRILFVFGNELDQISFGGEHTLDRDRWFFDTVNLWRAKNNLDLAESALTDAQNSGDQAAIDAAQANYDLMLAEYEAKAAEADPLKGDTSVLVAASSNDAKNLRFNEGFTDVGASLTVDAVRVETTNVLDVLRNPPAN